MSFLSLSWVASLFRFLKLKIKKRWEMKYEQIKNRVNELLDNGFKGINEEDCRNIIDFILLKEYQLFLKINTLSLIKKQKYQKARDDFKKVELKADRVISLIKSIPRSNVINFDTKKMKPLYKVDYFEKIKAKDVEKMFLFKEYDYQLIEIKEFGISNKILSFKQYFTAVLLLAFEIISTLEILSTKVGFMFFDKTTERLLMEKAKKYHFCGFPEFDLEETLFEFAGLIEKIKRGFSVLKPK